MAEKTDLGRVAGPSLVRLVDEAMSISGSRSYLNGKMSAEVWDTLEQMLEVNVILIFMNTVKCKPNEAIHYLCAMQSGSSIFSEPHKFGCFLVMHPNSPISVNSALRYWGCTIQAGAQVSGAFGIDSPNLNEELMEQVKRTFSPLPFAFTPQFQVDSPLDWNEVTLNTVGKDAKNLLFLPPSQTSDMSSVKFDPEKKSVTLLMPGFDKSEIKLYQVCHLFLFATLQGGNKKIVREYAFEVASLSFPSPQFSNH